MEQVWTHFKPDIKNELSICDYFGAGGEKRRGACFTHVGGAIRGTAAQGSETNFDLFFPRRRKIIAQIDNSPSISDLKCAQTCSKMGFAHFGTSLGTF